MLRQIFNLFGFKTPRKKKAKSPILLYKQQQKKIFFVVIFLTSFLFVQGLTWLLGAKSLPVVAQTPAGVTTPQSAPEPDTLVQEAKKLYRAEQFSEALSRLEQAANALAARRDVRGQAMTLDLQGQVYLALGQPEAAAERFSVATTTYERGGDKTGAIKSRLNEAEALRKAGFYRRALDALKQLNANLTDQTDPQLRTIALRSLGITQRLIGELDDAQKAIEESLKIAESLPSPAREENGSAAHLVLGNIAKDRGNTSQERGNNSEALTYFEEAIAHYQTAAKTATKPTARVEAQLNQLSIFGDSGQPFTDTEREILRQVRETLDQLPLARTAVHARINWARMVMEPKNEAKVSPQDIAQQLTIAVEQARTLKDQRSESYALGELGKLRQQLGQLEQAQENTQQALAIAQSIGAADVAYRWQWQLGQILIAQGKTQGAIASYEAAVNNLKSIRGDLVSVNPDVQFSFRESVEPVYRQLVGLLLQSNNPENLKKARSTIESLQQAELVDFFRENCLTASEKEIDEIDPKAAVIYPIVLPDSLEVVVTLPGKGLEHKTISKPGVEVQDIFTRLRRAVAPVNVNSNRATPNENEPNPATPEEPNTQIVEEVQPSPNRARPELRRTQEGGYLVLAQQVYDWLIRPFEDAIKASGVETLVFVLDSPMLNLPMAVLHDGEKFLVEKYAIARTPGLQLLDPKPLARGELTALKAGLSEASQGFPPLENVKRELEKIREQVSGEVLLNKEFTTDAIQQAIDAIDSVPFPVVHLATHGQFSSNAEETFILTWDGVLRVNELKELLQGREAGRTKAIELLVLSACETATGDRAALGLAAVAVRSGARSTLATLWVVNDESTADLMIKFYEELKDPKITKAEALRRAQVWLMKQNSRYEDPEYWAPFVLIGNWL
jgi:CHAT domain-containing protein/predicted negative regulator of RcsB-dependent stress response